jgi:hypothetical protein
MSVPEIASVSRCYFPSTGDAVLMAYGKDGKELLGIVCHPKNVRQWMRSSRSLDMARMKKEVADYYGADGTS